MGKEKQTGCLGVGVELCKLILDVDRFSPGFYVYMGRFIDDRDLKTLGWFGPFGSIKDAVDNIPDWWQSDGLEKPRIIFRIFSPFKHNKREE